MDGIINVYKPVGITSFDVVSVLRRITGVKKVGHTGTLDPNAQGVLAVCIGEALKCVEYMMDKDKEYRAELIFGSSTDTQDITGKVISVTENRAAREQLEAVVEGFLGKQMQTPPVYSAIKINGKKYCDLARKGLDADLKIEDREITVHNIRLEEVVENEKGFVEKAVIYVHCSKGTYIRTICHDIAIKAGTLATMSALTRTRAGAFKVEDSISLEQLQRMKEDGTLEKSLLNMDQAFSDCGQYIFDDDNIKRITNGIGIKLYLLREAWSDERSDSTRSLCESEANLEVGAEGNLFRVYDKMNRFRAVGKIVRDEQGKVLKGYRIFK